MKSKVIWSFFVMLTMLVAVIITPDVMAAGQIVHDAEHNILKAQHGERWVKEDAEINEKLAEIRKKNGNKPPNFIYILLDDLGFGEIGMPDLDVIRPEVQAARRDLQRHRGEVLVVVAQRQRLAPDGLRFL